MLTARARQLVSRFAGWRLKDDGLTHLAEVNGRLLRFKGVPGGVVFAVCLTTREGKYMHPFARVHTALRYALERRLKDVVQTASGEVPVEVRLKHRGPWLGPAHEVWIGRTMYPAWKRLAGYYGMCEVAVTEGHAGPLADWLAERDKDAAILMGW